MNYYTIKLYYIRIIILLIYIILICGILFGCDKAGIDINEHTSIEDQFATSESELNSNGSKTTIASEDSDYSNPAQTVNINENIENSNKKIIDNVLFEEYNLTYSISFDIGNNANYYDSIFIKPQLYSENNFSGGAAIINEQINYIFDEYADVMAAMAGGTYKGEFVYKVDYKTWQWQNYLIIAVYAGDSQPSSELYGCYHCFYYDIVNNKSLNAESFLSEYRYVKEELFEVFNKVITNAGFELTKSEQVEIIAPNEDGTIYIVCHFDDNFHFYVDLPIVHTELGDMMRAYLKAYEAMCWFELGSMNFDYYYHINNEIIDPEVIVPEYEPLDKTVYYTQPLPQPVQYKNGWYYKVSHDIIKTRTDLDDYLRTIFSDEIADNYMRDKTRYIDIDGELWGMEGFRGTDFTKGNATFSITEKTDTKIILTAHVELCGDVYDDVADKWIWDVIGYEDHNFIYEKVDNRWVFTKIYMYI